MLANTPISARMRWPVTIARLVAAGTVSTARVATDRTQRAAAGRRWVKRSKTLNAGVRDMEMLLTRREEPGGVPGSRTWPIGPPRDPVVAGGPAGLAGRADRCAATVARRATTGGDRGNLACGCFYWRCVRQGRCFSPGSGRGV